MKMGLFPNTFTSSSCLILFVFFAERLWTDKLEDSHWCLNTPRTASLDKEKPWKLGPGNTAIANLNSTLKKTEKKIFLKYMRKFRWERLQSHIWENAQIFNHIWGGRYSYMTLQPLPFGFPYIWYEENLVFFFFSVGHKAQQGTFMINIRRFSVNFNHSRCQNT